MAGAPVAIVMGSQSDWPTMQRAADALDALFRGIGMPTRVGELGVPGDSAGRVLEHALKNFNADPKREFVCERDLLKDVLLAAW
jgi:alcohol dehydrogenase class IV